MFPYLHKIYFLFLSIFLFLKGCAYFNTFYNAKVYYQDAEKIRIQKEGESIPISAIDKYGKVIEKCKKVLKDHPDSKYVSNAHLLMAKARFFRGDYTLALEDLKRVGDIKKRKIIEEAQYWEALCNWKIGKSNLATNQLESLLEISKSNTIKSKCYLSLSEIYREFSETEKMVSYLNQAAKFSSDRAEKALIYGRLAEIAFNKEDFQASLEGYRNLISYSLSKDKIEDANLQILKIMRLTKDYNAAEKKVKSLLLDEKFKGIAGDLELELVQLYRAQGDSEEIESRLNTIVNRYQKTSVSAEAYYQLGQIYSSTLWDLSKAKEYFSLVSKESSKSIFVPMANSRISAIDTYNDIKKDLETHQSLKKIENEFDDSTKTNVSVVLPDKTVPELLYHLGDLEAFTFKRYNIGIDYFNIIIEQHRNSIFHAKSHFALMFIYDIIGDSSSYNSTKNTLLTNFPNSEYSRYLDSELILQEDMNSLNSIFKNAEAQIKSNQSIAISIFKDILSENINDPLSPYAAMNLAYIYDEEAKVDSAIKYYNWIIDNHPSTEHSIKSQKRIGELNVALSKILETNNSEY